MYARLLNKRRGLLCRSRAACLTRLLQSQLWSEALWAWEFWDTLDSPCHRSTEACGSHVQISCWRACPQDGRLL